MDDIKYKSDILDIESEVLPCKSRDSFESFVPNAVMRNSYELISLKKNEMLLFFSSNEKYPVRNSDKEYPVQKPKPVIFSVVNPPFDTLKIRLQRCPYNRSNSFLLSVPTTARASAEIDAHIRHSFRLSYAIFKSLAPCLSIKPNEKFLCCYGSFTHDFSTCTFEAQILRLDPLISQGVHGFIYEFRQMTVGCRKAFSHLLQIMGVSLKEAGCTERYGNGCMIYPEGINEQIDVLSMMYAPEFDNTLMITKTNWPVVLDSFEVDRLVERLTEGSTQSRLWTFRFLAKCSSENIDNRKELEENTKLSKAVCRVLRLVYDPQDYFNALKLIEYGVVNPEGLVTAVGKSIKVYSGTCGGRKGVFSSSIVNAAIGAIHALVCAMPVLQREKVLRTVERVLNGEVREEVVEAIQDMRKTLGIEVSHFKMELSVIV